MSDLVEELQKLNENTNSIVKLSSRLMGRDVETIAIVLNVVNVQLKEVEGIIVELCSQ